MSAALQAAEPHQSDYARDSGLQYLGDCNRQFNWKTPKDYAGQCRTLTLGLSHGGTLNGPIGDAAAALTFLLGWLGLVSLFVRSWGAGL